MAKPARADGTFFNLEELDEMARDILPKQAYFHTDQISLLSLFKEHLKRELPCASRGGYDWPA